ncbi:MAG: polysaccharide biosynthesis tyrosine autokinase, partial [Paludibacter sp.]
CIPLLQREKWQLFCKTALIQKLDLKTDYFVKQGLRYDELYPLVPLKLILPLSFNDTIKNQVEFKIVRKENGYKVDFISGLIENTYLLTDINKPFLTSLGLMKFSQISDIKVGQTFKITTYPIRNLTENYCASVKVASVNKKSNAISVSTVSANFKKSEAILNTLIDLYNQDAIIDKNMIASNTADFVQERLKLISADLLNVELSVESYKKKNSLTDISSEAELFLESSSEYNKKLAELETQLNLVGYIESYVKDNKNRYNLVPANLGIEDKSLLELMQEYNKLLLERMKLMRTTNEKNPVITQLEEQLKALRASVITSIGSIKDGLKIAKKDVLGKDAQFASKIKDVPTQEREFLEIKRQQEIKQKLYLYLLQKREENALSLASTTPSAKTLDAAYTSILPVAPKRMIIFILSLMIGVIIPIGIIYLLEMFNNKISNKKEFKQLVKAPFLGSIMLNKDLDRVAVREGKTTPIVEMFRLIRTNLQFMLGGKTSPVILVTSSIGGEGKSYTSINMAMSFALLKKKVVLVGLDVRKPMLGEYMHISKDKGISVFLSNPEINYKDIIIPSGFHNYLSVIPAGPIPPNPAELLMSPRLDELILELKKDYDYIILDSAPIGLVSDTYLLNRLIDNCVFVARQNFTPRDMCDLISDIYKNKRLKNMAVILNGTDEKTGYGYGYDKNYHTDEYNVPIFSFLKRFWNK